MKQSLYKALVSDQLMSLPNILAMMTQQHGLKLNNMLIEIMNKETD